jgi:hypothetical protein
MYGNIQREERQRLGMRTAAKTAYPSRSTLVVWLFADALKCRRWCYGATDGINYANPRLATLEPLNTADER